MPILRPIRAATVTQLSGTSNHCHRAAPGHNGGPTLESTKPPSTNPFLATPPSGNSNYSCPGRTTIATVLRPDTMAVRPWTPPSVPVRHPLAYHAALPDQGDAAKTPQETHTLPLLRATPASPQETHIACNGVMRENPASSRQASYQWGRQRSHTPREATGHHPGDVVSELPRRATEQTAPVNNARGAPRHKPRERPCNPERTKTPSRTRPFPFLVFFVPVQGARNGGQPGEQPLPQPSATRRFTIGITRPGAFPCSRRRPVPLWTRGGASPHDRPSPFNCVPS